MYLYLVCDRAAEAATTVAAWHPDGSGPDGEASGIWMMSAVTHAPIRSCDRRWAQ